MPLIQPVPAADVTAIKTNNDRPGGRRGRSASAVFSACGWATTVPTRIVLFRTVLAFGAPLTGSNSDNRSATLPNGASAAYRAVT